jgi:transposase
MMNIEIHAVGIDVSKCKLDIAICKDKKIKSKVFDNTSSGHALLQAWLREREIHPENAHVCFEATGPYSEPLAIALTDMGWRVSVVNPARVKGFAQSELLRNKTDKADAALIARFCAALKPGLWTPPPLAYRQLRAWVDRLRALKDMQQQELNRLDAHRSNDQTDLIAHVQRHLHWLETEIAALEHDIDDHIDRHPDLKSDSDLMASIPGIGKTTAAKMLAYLGDIRRFDNAKALAAFVGVTPRQRQSGSSIQKRTMLSRTGHAAARQALYMPGLVARRHNPALKLFGDRLRERGLAPKAVIGAIMRKLVHIIYGVVTSGHAFNLQLALPRLDVQDGI